MATNPVGIIMSASSTADREDAIRRRAHQLWEAAGRPDGRAEEFWFAATGEAGGTSDKLASTPREQKGRSKGIAPGPSGMEQTDDQDNLNNNVSTVG
jgi:hypothetical protein